MNFSLWYPNIAPPVLLILSLPSSDAPLPGPAPAPLVPTYESRSFPSPLGRDPDSFMAPHWCGSAAPPVAALLVSAVPAELRLKLSLPGPWPSSDPTRRLAFAPPVLASSPPPVRCFFCSDTVSSVGSHHSSPSPFSPLASLPLAGPHFCVALAGDLADVLRVD
jgi:hypothetical protein